MIQLAGNFEKRDQDSIDPGNKAKCKKEKTDDHDRNNRVSFTKGISLYHHKVFLNVIICCVIFPRQRWKTE